VPVLGIVHLKQDQSVVIKTTYFQFPVAHFIVIRLIYFDQFHCETTVNQSFS